MAELATAKGSTRRGGCRINVLSQSDLIDAVRELAGAKNDDDYVRWADDWGNDLITTITEAGKVKARLDRVVHFMAMAVKASTSLITQLGALIGKRHGGVVLVGQINPIVQKMGGEIIGHSFCAEGAVLFDDPLEVQAYAEKKLLEQGDAAVEARGGDVAAERKALVAELEKSKRAAGFRQKKRTKKRKIKRTGPVAVPDLKAKLEAFEAHLSSTSRKGFDVEDEEDQREGSAEE